MVKGPLKRLKSKRNSVLNKIDPAILSFKPLAISQHASDDGTPITIAVNPVYSSPETRPEGSTIFNADPSNFDFGGEHLGDVSEEDIARIYYVSCVHVFFSPSFPVHKDRSF